MLFFSLFSLRNGCVFDPKKKRKKSWHCAASTAPLHVANFFFEDKRTKNNCR